MLVYIDISYVGLVFIGKELSIILATGMHSNQFYSAKTLQNIADWGSNHAKFYSTFFCLNIYVKKSNIEW